MVLIKFGKKKEIVQKFSAVNLPESRGNKGSRFQEFVIISDKVQQFPLSTAVIASYLYPALGGADARNEGEALRALPLAIPHGAENFLRKLFFIRVIYFIKSNG